MTDLRMRGFCGLLVLASFGVMSGCDRIEGQVKDLARSASEGAIKISRDVFVSDMQKAAEAMCVENFTVAPAIARSSRMGSTEPPTLFVSGNPPYPIEVRVTGDGKYELEVPLFRKVERQGLYTGYCKIESGRIVEATLSSPF